ncbi:Uncharacterized protein SCG7109_AA_00110 [Chlamydiales bacterium SCGC AG-110-M15]|nr:Uncharacterized protein SCG7109_AA_00110 [Chlamydiales bacterium SCGC AG-110-M15]
MDLKIKDVAELLSVSETTIRRWVADRILPAYRLNHQYRFSRTEIEDWVMKQRLNEGKKNLDTVEASDCNKDAKHSNSSGGTKQFSLYRAVHRGGIFHDIPGDTKEEVIKATMDILSPRLDLDAEVLTEMLLDRERMMPTALNNGLGVPHTRDFLLNQHYDAVAIAFPSKAIEYGSLDGEPVHTLFFLFACEDKRHLHLLAKLAHLADSAESLAMLRSQPDRKSLLEYIKNWESQAALAVC